MMPPVEFQDRAHYRQRMNDLLRIDARRTAVLTIDMQNDYLDMDAGTAPLTPADAERVLAQTRRLLDFARSHGIPVIHAYVKRRREEIGKGRIGTPMGAMARLARLSQNAQAPAREGPDRVEGTPQADVPEVLVSAGDIHVTTKRVQDSFHGTDLGRLLDEVFDVETLLIAGINTDTCVLSTTFSASNRGYRPVMISDCVASMRGADSHWMALELASRSIAWIMTVEHVIAKIEGVPAHERA